MSYETIANDYGLIDKVVIVSGGGGAPDVSPDKGVANGQAAAILLARAGAKVCVVGRTAQTVQNTVDIIKAEGGDAFAHTADVTTLEGCRSSVEAAMDVYGRLDGLDNNVGIGVAGSVVDLDIDTWRSIFASNVDSIMMLCKYAVPAMIKSGEGGAIVNISSLRSIRPLSVTAYSVTKGAVNALTTSLAVDHGADGIRANGIILGPVYTPNLAERLTPELRQKRVEASVTKIEGSGWDTGQLVRFLMSDQSRYMTGQNICLDGGASIMGPSR